MVEKAVWSTAFPPGHFSITDVYREYDYSVAHSICPAFEYVRGALKSFNVSDDHQTACFGGGEHKIRHTTFTEFVSWLNKVVEVQKPASCIEICLIISWS